VVFLEAKNMKYVPFLALLVFAAACGGGSEPAPERPAPPAEPRDDGKGEIRAKLEAKKVELGQADADLNKVAAEREQLAGQPASETKTNRLVELARLESDAKLRKGAIMSDIADLQAQLGGSSATAAAKPTKAGDALDDILAGNANKEKEEAERRKQKAEADSAADKDRLAKAEAARNAELEERAKQKLESGRTGAGADDGRIFEERWGEVINKVLAELQKYKRW
jgi:hypothetical protein